MYIQSIEAANIPLPELDKTARRAAPQRVFALFLDHLEAQAKAKKKRPFYVQVGAHDGVLDDPMFERAETGTWDGLLLEPSSIYVAKLKKLHAKRKGMVVQQMGISDAPGQMTLYRISERASALYPDGIAGCASLDRDHLWAHMAKIQTPEDSHIVAEKIKVARLDAVLTKHKVKAPTLLLVDVEGHEKHVFDGLDLTKHQPQMIYFERVHMGRGDVRALSARFKEAGYHLFRLRSDTLCIHETAMTKALFEEAVALGAVPK